MRLKRYKIYCVIFSICTVGIFDTFALEQKLFTEKPATEKEPRTTADKNITAWNYIEQAKREYAAGNLSEALVLANKANDENAAYYKSLRGKIESGMKRHSVLAEGDTISRVYNKLYELEEYETCKVFDTIFKERSIKSFSDSLAKLYTYLDMRALTFPESTYLIGLIFQAQGELKQAQNYYNTAWKQKKFLQNKDDTVNILYSLADVSALLGDMAVSEKFLLAILSSDELYANKSKSNSQLRTMMHTLKTNASTRKFFLLYRHDGSNYLKAAKKLTDIYVAQGKHKKALEISCCAVCIITTELEHYMKMKNFLYTYQNLDDLILKCAKDFTINEWATDQDFWNTYLQFADILVMCNLPKQAEDVYAAIASSVPDYHLAQRAFYAIQKLKMLEGEQKANDLKTADTKTTDGKTTELKRNTNMPSAASH